MEEKLLKEIRRGTADLEDNPDCTVKALQEKDEASIVLSVDLTQLVPVNCCAKSIFLH